MSNTTQISQLVLRERQSRVRGLVGQLRGCFHPGATVTTSWVHGSTAAFVSGAEARSGTVSGDLYGIDRPDTVNTRYGDAFTWMNAEPGQPAGQRSHA